MRLPDDARCCSAGHGCRPQVRLRTRDAPLDGARFAGGGEPLKFSIIPVYESEPYKAEILLPEDLLTIEEKAFENDTFESIRLPNVRTIKSHAFAGCSNLKKIVICSLTINIAPDAFEGIPENAVIVAPEDSDAYVFAKEKGFAYRKLVE